MAYTAVIYDPVRAQNFDISDRLVGIAINEALDSDVTTFTAFCIGILEVHVLNHISIYKDGQIFLSGIVLNQHDNDGGSQKVKLSNFECEDWGHIFTKRIVSETYLKDGAQQGRPDLILKHMIGKYAPEFTTNNVDVCSIIIDRLQYPYVMLKEAIESIMDITPGWHWYVDRNKDFHFFNQYEYDGPQFTKDNISLKSLRVQYEAQEHVNRVWIVGRKQAGSVPMEEFFTGDGVQRYFKLAYEPNDTEIFVDGVLKESSLEINDNGERDFLINKTEKVFYIPSYRTPFTGIIKASYKPTKQFIDMYENASDKNKFGLMEKAVKNSSVTDKLEARKYGMAEVSNQSTVRRKVSFRSRTADISIGQRCSVNIVTQYWNVVGSFLVKAVKRDITPGDELVQFELEELL